MSQACEEERMNDPAKQTYYLLQKQIIKSSFLLYCGMWSHQKFAYVPKMEITQELFLFQMPISEIWLKVRTK